MSLLSSHFILFCVISILLLHVGQFSPPCCPCYLKGHYPAHIKATRQRQMKTINLYFDEFAINQWCLVGCRHLIGTLVTSAWPSVMNGAMITCGHELIVMCLPTRLWEDLCTSSNSSSLSSNSFWWICFILSISISKRMWICQRERKKEKQGEKDSRERTFLNLFVCVGSTCCCCCILAVSAVISCALSLAWLSRKRSCFLRSGSESEARSTGRLRSRIWAHNSSFCFCRRPTSDWLSCTCPHKYVLLIWQHLVHPPTSRVCVCPLVTAARLEPA